ncbi:helix-turn-helix transcriptional regulator [Phytoactinopolyspora alkaliphila]
MGRRHELAVMTAALDDAPALVLLEGEAGIGKTRLIHECLAARPVKPHTLQVTCPPLLEPFPLGAVVDALQATLRETMRKIADGTAGIELSPLTGALRPLFPEWAEALPPAMESLDDPKATRHRLLRALMELIERCGVNVLVFDDAHWADAASLELLLMLAASPLRRMNLIVSYRSTDVPAGSVLRRLTSSSAARTGSARIVLEPLTVTETTQMIAGVFETRQVSGEFATFIHERTAGLPLALEETMWLLRDRGDIFPAADGWGRRALSELQVPPTVRDSVLERVERLDPAAQRVLEAAATFGEPAGEPALGAVSELDAEHARRGLAAALSSGLLIETEPDQFVCRHALASRAVEEAVPASERRRMHRRAAEALAGMEPVPVARLCRHYREAGDVGRWAEYAEAAAARALESGDDHAAVVFLYDVVTTAELSSDLMIRLARKLGEAAAWGGASLGTMGRRVCDALSAVLDAVDVPAVDRGEVRLLLGRLHLQLGEFETAVREIEAAVAELDERPDLGARAMISLAFPRGHDWPASRHRSWLDRAVALRSRVSSRDERIWLAVDRASVLLMLGDDAGWVAVDEIEDRNTDEDGDETGPATLFELRQIARGLMNAGHFAIAWGRYAESRRRLTAAVDLMRSSGYGRLVNSAQLTVAHLDWQTGAWTGLADRIRQLAQDEDTLPEAQLEAALLLGLLDLSTGKRQSAHERLRNVLDEAIRRGLIDVQGLPAAALGRLHLADGAPDRAVAVTQPVVELIDRKDMWLWATDVMPVFLDALVAAGDTEAVAAWARRFTAGLGDRHAPAPQAAARLCQAVAIEAAGRPGRAAALFGDVAREWRDLPRPYDGLLTMERRGRALLSAGDEAGAVDTLVPTQRALVDAGARWDADRVAHLLRRHGVEVARAWRGGRRGYGDQLSPRELEVVRLVATGLTSRKVAETLFLSPRTVDRHLSSAMRKLDVSSRAALALAASDTGLLDLDHAYSAAAGTGQASASSSDHEHTRTESTASESSPESNIG